MKKHFFLLLAIIVIANFSLTAQSIFPVEGTEICPNQNITFTVTLPRILDGTTPSVASWTNGPIVVSGVSNITNTTTNTTFTFVGKFQDRNLKQVFKIDYQTKSTQASYYPTFSRIKSLYFSTFCAQIPNSPSVTVPLCQIVDIPVSFGNRSWGTSGEVQDVCWGTITSYEYLIPAGWKIGSTVSTGTNWIPAGNSVTVTSDATNGVNGYI